MNEGHHFRIVSFRKLDEGHLMRQNITYFSFSSFVNTRG